VSFIVLLFSDDNFHTGDRVKWYRDRSHRDRLREEKEILEEELKRTSRYFAYMKGTWLTLAKDHEESRPGKAAYANKQAAVYECLRGAAATHKTKANQKGNQFETWYKHYKEGK
jgi:hypothetical protein